jgi:hypothetical protein
MNTRLKYARRTETTQDDAETWNDPHAQISRCWSSPSVRDKFKFFLSTLLVAVINFSSLLSYPWLPIQIHAFCNYEDCKIL